MAHGYTCVAREQFIIDRFASAQTLHNCYRLQWFAFEMKFELSITTIDR